MTASRWVLLLSCLAGGIGALLLGFSLEWDLLNYHLYNPHALLNGRLAIDVAAAQQQTYLNPALYIPLYLVFEYLGADAFVFVIGAIQGSQLALLVLILNELTGRRFTQPWILLPVALLGMAGPIFLNQLGGSQGDTVLSVLVLGGLLMILKALPPHAGTPVTRVGFLAGLLLGMACALKLTLALYAVSMALAAFVCFSGPARWRITRGLAIGGVAGVLLAGGPWFFYLWSTYESPLFPFFNNLFASPWVDQGSYRDLRFMPRQWIEWLFYPFFWVMDPQRVWEFSFRDIRVPLAIAVVFVLPLFAWRRARQTAPALVLVWIFLASSYLLWIRLFSIYRYLSVVELLAPLVLFSSAALFIKSRNGLVVALVLLLGSQALVQFHRGNSTREFQPGTETVFADLPPGSMIVIDGYDPIAYAALWLDQGIPVVRIRANFMRTSQPQHRLHESAQQRVIEHPGPHYLLATRSETEADFLAADMARVGLEPPQPEACKAVFVSETLQNRLGLVLCPLNRLPDDLQPESL